MRIFLGNIVPGKRVKYHVRKHLCNNKHFSYCLLILLKATVSTMLDLMRSSPCQKEIVRG